MSTRSYARARNHEGLQIQGFRRLGNVWVATVCCPGMLRIAARVRPPFVGALLLAGFVVIPWNHDRSCETHGRRVASAEHGSIVLTPWDRVELGPQDFEILRPPA